MRATAWLGFTADDVRLLRHRERTGDRHLHAAISVSSKELQVFDCDRTLVADRAGDTGNRIRLPAAIQCRARVIDIDTLECRGETVRVTLTSDFAVCDDIQAGLLLRLDRRDRGIVLRFR